MLIELRIKNFAIIDSLELRFGAGFNVITGETGAGKSILIDAVDLLLGGRADRTMVRAGARRAVIEGVFDLARAANRDAVAAILERESLEGDEDDILTLARQVRENGRNVCRVNGVTVSAALLQEIGACLVDIHGQGEHLSLLRPREHIHLLDRYADLEEPREALAVVVCRLDGVRRELRQLIQDEAALARRADLLRFQIDEIGAANPKAGEDDELLEERIRLANAEQLTALAKQAQRALYDGDEMGASAVDRLEQAAAALGKLVKIDAALAEQHALIESLSAQADDLARTLRAYAEGIEFSPQRLNAVEARLDALSRLKRKYGGTVEAVLAWAEKAQTELDAITHSEARLEELRAEEDEMLHRVGEMAAALSDARRDAAVRLAGQIVAELGALRMERAQFEASIAQREDAAGAYAGGRRLAFDSTGIDQVEFMVSANPGEPLRPLARVASGGETSRLMLALKTVLSRADATPTLIFDEVDQGIGGRVGTVVGQKLWGLSDGHQVLVITHLAQLAGFGDTHYLVSKRVHGDRTLTEVRQLDDEARINELAAMLGADAESARRGALGILEMAREAKATRTNADLK
ncbi:MAG: DNA repair protein RecN [Anaerolineae bacterium]|nr:DNA repair protein RecN [Anaerolineae bacterium]